MMGGSSHPGGGGFDRRVLHSEYAYARISNVFKAHTNTLLGLFVYDLNGFALQEGTHTLIRTHPHIYILYASSGPCYS